MNLNMFGLGIKHWVLCQLYAAKIVAIYDNLFVHVYAKTTKVAYVTKLLHMLQLLHHNTLP